MRIILTQKQLTALHEYFAEHVVNDRPENIAEALVKSLVMRVFQKMNKKVYARLQGMGYSLHLTDEEAMAYYVYFQNRFIGEGYQYQQLLIQTHINQIDQAYA